MQILILGGTAFLGPALVEYALERGHEITLFNRGRTNPHLFPDLEKLRGDRDPEKDEGLTELEGRQWDAVIDTSGYVPRHARASAEVLAGNVRQYAFISTISVYPMTAFREPGVSEETPVDTIEDESVEQVNGVTYGPLKALCEQAVQAVFAERATIIRPGLIVGPDDPTDRFTYWPVRIDRGGEVLAPEPRDNPVQFIDARDLAGWTVRMVEEGHGGVFNATGPESELSRAGLLYGCRAVTSAPVTFTWIEESFLAENGVGLWTELPLAISSELAGFGRVSVERALTMGLTFRPLAETARDTLVWHRENRADDYEFGSQRGRSGMRRERELALLKAWHEREPSG